MPNDQLPLDAPAMAPATIDADAEFASWAVVPASTPVATIEEAPAPAVIQEGPGALLSAIVTLAKDPAVDVTKLQALMAMQERMEDRQAARLFGDALARIQAKVPRVPKSGIVQLGERKGGYDFGRWEDLDEAISPFLKEEGFTVTFSEAGVDQHGIVWEATWRAFGHSDRNRMTLPPDTGAGRNALQARGSTNSYAKRYLVSDFLKITFVGNDDDGKRGGTTFIGPNEVARFTKGLSVLKLGVAEFLDKHDYEGKNLEDVTIADYPKLIGILEEKYKTQQERKRGAP